MHIENQQWAIVLAKLGMILIHMVQAMLCLYVASSKLPEHETVFAPKQKIMVQVLNQRGQKNCEHSENCEKIGFENGGRVWVSDNKNLEPIFATIVKSKDIHSRNQLTEVHGERESMPEIAELNETMINETLKDFLAATDWYHSTKDQAYGPLERRGSA